MTSDRRLPDGWQWVRFGEVVRNVQQTTKDPESEGLTHIVGLEHLDSESLRLRRWNELADLPDGTSFTRVFRSGQVLFGKRRAYQRKVAVAEFDGVCSGDILVFEPSSDKLLLDFLPYLVQSDGFFNHALGTSAGSLSPRTKWQELAKYELPLPSTSSQARVVQVLKTVATQVHALDAAEAALQQLRAALVTDAAKSAPGLWSVADIVTTDSQGVQVGPFGGSLSSRYFAQAGVPILKINNITESGRLDLSDLVHTSQSHAEKLSRYQVQCGDIVTAAQATVGRTAVVPPEAEGALISQHLIRVRPDPDSYRPILLAELFNSPLVLRQMEMVKTKTTRDGLNTSDVEGFQIPRLSLAEQDTLVQDLETSAQLMKGINAHRVKLATLNRALMTRMLELELDADV
jgi:type I restriction enzyme S subunit